MALETTPIGPASQRRKWSRLSNASLSSSALLSLSLSLNFARAPKMARRPLVMARFQSRMSHTSSTSQSSFICVFTASVTWQSSSESRSMPASTARFAGSGRRIKFGSKLYLLAPERPRRRRRPRARGRRHRERRRERAERQGRGRRGLPGRNPPDRRGTRVAKIVTRRGRARRRPETTLGGAVTRAASDDGRDRRGARREGRRPRREGERRVRRTWRGGAVGGRA